MRQYICTKFYLQTVLNVSRPRHLQTVLNVSRPRHMPVPDFISSDERQDEALEILKKRVTEINKLDPLIIAIACNTAHILLNNLQKASHAPFISMIDETVKVVNRDALKSVGLLGTPSTIKSNIYQDAFKKINIPTITVNGKAMDKLENIIRNVIAGKIDHEDQLTLKQMSDELVDKGAQAIVLGCTELPLLFPKKYKKKVYNSSEILCEVMLKKYYNQKDQD